MTEYYLKSVEGKITFTRHFISILRMQMRTVIEFAQVERIEYKIEGPYGKLFFVFKDPELMKNIDKSVHNNKLTSLFNISSNEDYAYHFMLSFERMYENEFGLLKDYLNGYITGNMLDFNKLDIVTVQEQAKQQSEQIIKLIKQRHWENEQYGTAHFFSGNIFFVIITVVGLVSLIDVIFFFT